MHWWLTRLSTVLGTLVALFVANLLIWNIHAPYYYQILIQCGIAVILAVSLNLINGLTGQFSIGHAGFYAIGAYVGAAWTTLWLPRFFGSAGLLKLGTSMGDILNLLIAMALGMIAAAIAGFLVGLPSLRLRGDYLAIVTLGFGEVIRVVLLNIDAVGGARGLIGIPTLVSSGNLAVFWVFLFGILIICLSRNLLRSVRGLTWLAIREDEIAADAMGVNTTRVKVTAFVIGSAFAGAAGVLYAHFFTQISPDVFDMNQSITITTMVVLGGTGSVTGSATAAVLLAALPEFLRANPLFSSFQNYRMVIYSTLLIVMMLTRPQGIFGHREFSVNLFRRKRRTAAATPTGGGAPT